MVFCLWRNVMTTVAEKTEGFKSLGSGKTKDDVLQIDVSALRLAADYKSFGKNGLASDTNAKPELGKEAFAKGYVSLGANGNTKTFEGYSPRLEKAAHGKPSMSDRVASLLNAVKAPFKPKKVRLVNTTNKGNSGR